MTNRCARPDFDRRRRRAGSIVTTSVVCLFATVLGSLGCGHGAALAKAASDDASVRIERGRISAEVAEVPIVVILTQVAQGTGAKILVRGELGLARPQSFSDVPMQDGLERLVAPNHLVVEYAPSASGVANRITRIRVFGPGAETEKAIEPQAIGPSSPPPKDTVARAVVTPFDGNLGWTYDDDSTLPPLALRVRKIGTIYPTSGDDGVNALGEVIENDPDVQVRVAALRALTQFSGESGYALVQTALVDESPEVRLAAINAVDPTANEPSPMLLELVANADEQERLRLAGIERLTGYREREEVRAVLHDLEGADNARVRAAAKALLLR